jgi:hypothetical protein
MALMGALQSLVKLANEVGLPNEDLNFILNMSFHIVELLFPQMLRRLFDFPDSGRIFDGLKTLEVLGEQACPLCIFSFNTFLNWTHSYALGCSFHCFGCAFS